MKKSILFLLALFSVTMTTQAAYYYRGDKNSWRTGIQLTQSADGYYYYYEATAGTHNFKILNNATSWSATQWNENNILSKYNGTDVAVTKAGSDQNIKCSAATKHYILFYPKNTTLNPSGNDYICASSTLPNGFGEVHFKHPWNGGSWTYQTATNNGDGTFSYVGKYGGAGVNWCVQKNGTGEKYIATPTLVGSPVTGDDCTFTFNGADQTVTITKKVNKNIGDIIITMNCTQQPKIFFWDVEGKTCAAWPGEDMVAAGANTYTYTFEDVDVDLGVNYKINLKAVNENEWASGDLHTTSDVTHDASIFGIPEIVVLGVNGDWGSTNTLTELSNDYLTASKTISVTNAAEFDLKCHVGTGQYYGSNTVKITRDNPSSNKFDKDYGNGNGKFVADIAGDYVFTWTYKTGTLTVTYPELPTPEYKDITIQVYAKQVPNIWWWNGGDKCADADDAYDWVTAPAMEAVVIDGNTWYQKTFKDVDVTLGGIKFKLKSQDQSKESNELQTTEDKCYDARVITAITETPCGQLPTGETPKVTYNVEVPAGTNTCYIAGEMNGWGFTNEMTKVDDTHYTITIEGATTAQKYKYTSGPGWEYVEQTAEAGNVADRTWAENDVVAKWASVYNPSAPTYDYYIAGTLAGGWSATQQGMTKEDDVYKHTFLELNSGTYEFKITDGQWNSEGDATHEHTTLGAEYEEVSYNEGNIKIVTDEAINLTVIFDAANDEITFEGLTEKAPVVSTYALMGVGGDWTTGITMTVNPDNADEYVLKAQSISSTDAIKVLETAGSTQTWHSTVDAYSNATFELVDDGFGGKNIVLTAGTYNFYFKKINNEIYIEEVYVRDVTNTYGTICLPYASNSYDGAIFYRVAGKETGKVYLESVSELEAGVPYIFEKTASKIVVARNGAPVANAGSANGLVGTFTNETEVAAGNYILYNNQLRPSDGTAKVNANRAYLKLDAVTGGQPTQMPGRRYIGMDVQGENEATGFENITAPEGQAMKVIENGQLIIIRGNEKFNAQGVRL